MEQVYDFNALVISIVEATKQTIGVTTLKRLFGYIDGPKETNKGTLNIIAQYLEFPLWQDYEATVRINSDWNIEQFGLQIYHRKCNSPDNDAIFQLERKVRKDASRLHSNENGILVLTSDKTFSSPSTAADFCICRINNNNGWLV